MRRVLFGRGPDEKRQQVELRKLWLHVPDSDRPDVRVSLTQPPKRERAPVAAASAAGHAADATAVEDAAAAAGGGAAAGAGGDDPKVAAEYADF